MYIRVLALYYINTMADIPCCANVLNFYKLLWFSFYYSSIASIAQALNFHMWKRTLSLMYWVTNLCLHRAIIKANRLMHFWYITQNLTNTCFIRNLYRRALTIYNWTKNNFKRVEVLLHFYASPTIVLINYALLC